MVPMLFIAPLAGAVEDFLKAAPPGPILVLGSPRLARGLAERSGRRVIAALASPRRRRRRDPETLACDERALPVAEGSLAAVVAAGAGEHLDWRERFAEWARVVTPGGAIVLVAPGAGRARATEFSRRALCAGLTEIEQRQVGRCLLTSGRVVYPDYAAISSRSASG